MKEVCKFVFSGNARKAFIEEQITLAVITAECVFGPAKVRLHAGYLAADGKVVIDVSSDVGEHIAQVFTGLMIKRLGEAAFTVSRSSVTPKAGAA
jgi:hypothetical protein